MTTGQGQIIPKSLPTIRTLNIYKLQTKTMQKQVLHFKNKLLFNNKNVPSYVKLTRATDKEPTTLYNIATTITHNDV